MVDPKDEIARYNLGFIWEEKGQLKTAINACRKAIHAKKDYSKARERLSLALRKQSREERLL